MHLDAEKGRESSQVDTAAPLDGMQYWISKHIYVSATHHGGVILDLKHNKYLGVGRRQMLALASTVNSWPLHASLEADRSHADDATALLSAFRAQGLVTTDRSQAQAATRVELCGRAVLATLGTDPDVAYSVRAKDIGNFLLAWSVAALTLRCLPFNAAVSRVARRRDRAAHAESTFDVAKAERLIALFRHLKSFVFTSTGRCLFHSLVLIEFLSRYDLFPRWVLGVRTAPFGAHSWVQEGNMVLDGTPELICFYTPILVV